jgi:hypothetical protein
MRSIAILVCLLIAYSDFAQVPEKFRKSQKHQQDQNYHGPRVLFKVAPLALIDGVSFPTIQGGVEIALSPRIGWYNEVGFRYRKGSDAYVDTSFLSSTGYKVKSEFRYYFKAKYDDHGNWLRDHYVAINFYYSKSDNNADLTYFYRNDSTTSLQDCFGVTKTIWGTNLIFGCQRELNKRFLVDVYGGLGTRFRDFVSVGKQYDPELDELKGPRHPNIYNLRNKAEAKGGKSGTINISFGVRVACRLF